MIYAVVAPAALWVTFRYGPRVLSRLSQQNCLYLLLLTFVALAAIFAVVYPKANVHLAGRGSDADDGLNLAVNELLNGRYPYYARTYLDNPLSPLPGAILLAIPLVLLGSSAHQNLSWLAVFCFVLFRMMQSWRGTLILFWTILIFSPVVMNDVVTGGDYPANTIYVLGFMLLTLSWGSRADRHRGKDFWRYCFWVSVYHLGQNFLLLMPQLFSALTLRAGWLVKHQAERRNLVKRLCDCSGISGHLRGYAFRNSDGNAFAYRDQLWSVLSLFRRDGFWAEDDWNERRSAERSDAVAQVVNLRFSLPSTQ